MSMLHWAIISPFLLAIFVPFLYKYVRPIHTGLFILPLPIILFIYFIQYISITEKYGTQIETVPWIPSLGLDFTAYVDGLGLLFALLITGIGSLVILYSVYYLSKEKEKLHHFYVYLLLFIGAMLGVVLSDNLMVLYLFWELTSLSSFLLIGYWNERERSRYGAQKSMLITIFGGLALLGGFLLLSVMGGTYSIRELAAQSSELAGHSLFVPALLLILLGAFTKSAQFPFYIWLPDAMEAPTPVSAYLHSATMVKAGIYLVARLTPIFAVSPLWIWLVGGIGILTLFWASFHAPRQTDLKGILAYSTVSQLGLIMSLLGVGALSFHYDTIDDNIYIIATVAAVFHLINHATFKGSLFMVVGIVDHETGTRDVRRLGGLMTVMPITFTVALIGALSMAGMPPFNGFLSKEMFFTAMVRVLQADIFSLDTWGILFPVIAWIASVFTFLYSFLLLGRTFFGSYQPEQLPKKPHEAPLGMLIAPVVLALLVIVFGLFPNMLSHTLIAPAADAILTGPFRTAGSTLHISHWHGWTIELWMTIGVIVLGTMLYKTFPRWKSLYQKFPKRLSLNHLYDRMVDGMERGSYTLTESYMTGYIRTYFVYILSAFIALLAFSILVKGKWHISTDHLAPVGAHELVLSLIIIAGTITTIMAKSRLTAIIALGSVGYTVTLFFVLFRAPDLALTQLVIETISVSLFLLCFYHLPQLSRHEKGIRFRLGNALISIGVGVIVSLIALLSYSQKNFDTIAQYYVENTYEKAAGKNMVNVILVDFRGFDTMFEICVLGIAALGIYVMVKLRMSKGEK
ncbi:Na+/H+ antiporter subunit A [Parageobacillus toebii]|uniref:Na+/H+ antiporter subunit A n=1 Tax=Parageobacillus toebii TaxID=153151 RepID=UPI002E1B4226|nr:Na+/H+ antiporter subunit A [Parageobacillus toebii]MED4988222.1 Na+/H+ antiporter subunit A [Parageobacillus toebii]